VPEAVKIRQNSLYVNPAATAAARSGLENSVGSAIFPEWGTGFHPPPVLLEYKLNPDANSPTAPGSFYLQGNVKWQMLLHLRSFGLKARLMPSAGKANPSQCVGWFHAALLPSNLESSSKNSLSQPVKGGDAPT